MFDYLQPFFYYSLSIVWHTKNCKKKSYFCLFSYFNFPFFQDFTFNIHHKEKREGMFIKLNIKKITLRHGVQGKQDFFSFHLFLAIFFGFCLIFECWLISTFFGVLDGNLNADWEVMEVKMLRWSSQRAIKFRFGRIIHILTK